MVSSGLMVPFPIAAVEFHHYLIELFRQETIDQRILGTSSFSLRTSVVVFSTTAVSAPFIASALLRLQLPFLLLLLWLYCLVGAARCAECSHCTVLSFFLLFLFFSISPPLCLFGKAAGLFDPVIVASLFGL